ncbi:MAG: Gfo/Idh/MocA family oxidoreductase, partial [Bacteroidota bacterium]
MGTRREFIKRTAAGATGLAIGGMALSSVGYANVLGANDRIRVAVFGIRGRAKALVESLHKDANARVLYNCDVDAKVIDEIGVWFSDKFDYQPKYIKDFRKALEDKDVDAVFIATPEHWHAPMAILALQAGKHVYVEKPCSHNLFENELLVKAQKKYNKVVQMGNQQRSASTSIRAIKEIREGVIGEVYKGEAYYSNNRGSIGQGNKVAVPDTLDWDMWQGPAPREAFRDNIHPYNWHWFRAWGTGEVHNNGTHEIDVCRWALGVGIPQSVTSFGGKYTYQDDWEFVDNQQVTYQYEGNKTITWTGHSRGVIMPKQPGRGATIYGSKGIMTLSRNAYELYDLGGKLIKQEEEKVKSGTIDTLGGGGLTD